MAEKEKSISMFDPAAVKAAADSISSFSKQLKECSELISGMTAGTDVTALGFIELAASVSGTCSAFIDMKESIIGYAGAFKTSFDEKIISRFTDAVTRGAKTAGDGITDYKNNFGKLEGIIQNIPSVSKRALGILATNIDDIVKKTKSSFSSLADSVKNFSLSGMVDSIKNLPSTFDSALGKAGEALSGNASRIGSAARTALSVGLTAGAAIAAAAIIALAVSFKHLMESNAEFR